MRDKAPSWRRARRRAASKVRAAFEGGHGTFDYAAKANYDCRRSARPWQRRQVLFLYRSAIRDHIAWAMSLHGRSSGAGVTTASTPGRVHRTSLVVAVMFEPRGALPAQWMVARWHAFNMAVALTDHALGSVPGTCAVNRRQHAQFGKSGLYRRTGMAFPGTIRRACACDLAGGRVVEREIPKGPAPSKSQCRTGNTKRSLSRTRSAPSMPGARTGWSRAFANSD